MDYECGIQLASFYQPGNFLPHVKMMGTGFTDNSLLASFGMEYGIIRTPRPYNTTTLNYNWQIWETKAFSMYTNATDTVDEKSARVAVEGIIRFLYNVGIITKKASPGYNTEIIPETGIEQVRTEKAGLFVSLTETGGYVEENQVIGRIINPYDCEVSAAIRSEFSGVVYFEYNKPLINENTVCFKIIKD